MLHTFIPHSQQPKSAIVTNFDAYHFLARLIFSLSNKHKIEAKEDIFEIINDYLPEKYLEEFFLIDDTPSVRSAWEKLVVLAGKYLREDVFEILMSIGH